ncbi:hypothetical protein, partial [Pseudomonas syringae]|uniref:hypothetical protein n=1 Tax=Pseudomonas syringae TaxID=317 RepID=UPI001CA5214C
TDQQIFSDCTGLFVSKLTPTGPRCVQAMWLISAGSGYFEPYGYSAAPLILWELAREGVLTDQQIFSGCTGLFVSKLTPTGPRCFQAMWLISAGSGYFEPCGYFAAPLTLWE